MNRAIFLDRDGVITKPVFDTVRQTERAPWHLNEVEFFPNVISSLKKFTDMGYSIFIVSNQPDFVKKLVDKDSLMRIRKYVFETILSNKINLMKDYYCFHHPDFCVCECRKPSPYFLLQAGKSYNINLSESWMIGDRETDIVCGKEARTKTIKISQIKSDLSDFMAKDLSEAVEIVEFCNKIEIKT